MLQIYLYRYSSALDECVLAYVTRRKVLLGASISNTLSNYTSSGSDYCSTLRSSCKILIQLTHDENRLYQCFFTNKSPVFGYDKMFVIINI